MGNLFLSPPFLPSYYFDKMVIEWDVQSTSNLETVYKIRVDSIQKTVECNCTGFMTHGRCRHVKFYKRLIKKLIKNE